MLSFRTLRLALLYPIVVGLSIGFLLTRLSEPEIEPLAISPTPPPPPLELPVASVPMIGLTEVSSFPGAPGRDDYNCSEILQFVDQQHGWLKNCRGLWRTIDGGQSWSNVFRATKEETFGDRRNVAFFQFLDRQKGWSLIDQKLHVTSDGGTTWKAPPRPRGGEGFYAFSFNADGQTGWLAGVVESRLRDDEVAPNRFTRFAQGDEFPRACFPAIFQTTDGGSTWKRQPVARNPGDIYYMTSRGARAWAIGQAGYFFLEQGRWRRTESDAYDRETPRVPALELAIGMPTYAPNNIHFIDSDIGWLINSNGSVAMTRDGGRTWETRSVREDVWGPEYTEDYFFDVHFISETEGLAIDRRGDLFASNDAGSTWVPVAEDAEIRDIEVHEEAAWAVSKTKLYRLDVRACLDAVTDIDKSREARWAVMHRRRDRHFAAWLGMPLEQVQHLRRSVGIVDDSDEFVDYIDTMQLADRGHYLIVSWAGNGHCLSLYAVEPSGVVVWSVDSGPTGAGLCRESPTNPSARFEDGDIVVKIPVFDYPNGVWEDPKFVRYRWDGRSYVPVGDGIGD